MGLNVASRVCPPPLPYKPTTSPPPSPVASLSPPRRGGIRRSESAIFTTTTLKLSARPSHHQSLRRTVSATCSYFGEGSGTSSSSSNPNEEFARYIAEFTCEEPTFFDDNHNHHHRTMIPSPPPRPPTASTSSFRPSKLELLEPSSLGIRPDPPDWPARDELIRHEIARRANCVDIPLSVRMIMKKRQQQRREMQQLGGKLDGVGIAKAFCSTVNVIREMQNRALQLRGLALNEDFESIKGTAEVEMNSSFVWLFREVFSRTPDLMVDVMMLTVDFASVSVHKQCAALAEAEAYAAAATALVVWEKEKETAEEVGFMETSERPPSSSVLRPELREKDQGLKERSNFSGKKYAKEVDYEVYYRTDLFYQMGISKEPDNALLFSNYAQFLFLVSRDFDRAEECYKRAIQLDPADPEAMSRYANFLWKIRDDLWGAEDMFQRAAAADPENSFHVSNYAHFLWSTGADDTCYPLDPVS